MAIGDLIPWKSRERSPARRGQESPVASFRREMDRLFDEFFGSEQMPAIFGESWEGFSPQVDVSETAEEIMVTAELPGMDEKDIDVSLSPGGLTISGEKKEETKVEQENYYRTERTYGSFRRAIPLPTGVDTDHVEAYFQKGVLTVTLPKTAETQERKKIAVQTK